MGDETPIVNVAKCVAFITANSKRNDSEYHPFIQQFIGELSLIVDGDGTINPLDKSTWNGKDLTKLELGIWNYIGPRSTHQQLAENLVQTAGHLAKTM
jgi:hypothetical protein